MTVAAAAAPFEAGDSQNYLRQSGAVLMSTAMALCNDAQPGQKDGQEVFLGDPTETALSDYVKPLGYEAVRLVKRLPRVDEVPFDSQRKMMTTVHKEGNRYRVFVKGGLDEVLAHCTKVFDGKERRSRTRTWRASGRRRRKCRIPPCGCWCLPWGSRMSWPKGTSKRPTSGN